MIKKVVLWILLILLSTLIFSSSQENSTVSGGRSQKIANAVADVIKKVPTFSEVNKNDLRDTCELIIRKTAHFSVYLLLAIIVFELAASYNIKRRYVILISALYCLTYAISDEVHQLFIEGRSGQVSDVLIDFSGAIIGILLRLGMYRIVFFYQKKKKYKKI